jgi:hypothetical protein
MCLFWFMGDGEREVQRFAEQKEQENGKGGLCVMIDDMLVDYWGVSS